MKTSEKMVFVLAGVALVALFTARFTYLTHPPLAWIGIAVSVLCVAAGAVPASTSLWENANPFWVRMRE